MIDSRILCLGALRLGCKTGYDIKKMFEDGPLSRVYATGYGSIYPALGKLTDEGLVGCQTEHAASGPTRKVYSLTDAGVTALARALEDTPQIDKYRSDFFFMMLFSDLVRPCDLTDHFDAYLDRYRTLLQIVSETEEFASEGHEFIAGLGKEIYQTIVTYMETHRDELINALPDQKPLPEQRTARK